MTGPHGPASQVRTGPIVAGAVVPAVGAALLLDTTGALDIEAGRLIGPFVLIAIGTTMRPGGRSCRVGEGDVTRDKLRHGARQRWMGGLWMIGLGCWLLVSQTRMFGLTFGTSWPLLLILMGALMAIRGWR